MANVSSSNGLEKRPRLAFRNTDGSHFPCWRQTSLSCIIEPYSEKVYGEHDYEVLTSAREGLQRQEDHFGSKQRHDTDGYNIIPFGYCTYRNRSDDGKFAFNINTISEKAIVSKFYPVFRFTNANSTFMAEFLNSSPRVKKKLSVLAVGTSQVVLSFEALKAAKFDLPCKDEQDKIAAFLECLNARIENQRTLVVALKKYKRGVVRTLLSPKRCSIKNVKWTTSRIGDIGTFIKGAPLSKADISLEGTPFILYGELYTTYSEVISNVVRKTQASADKQYYSQIGDVIIPTSGETPEEISTASCVMLSDIILAGDLNIYRCTQVDGRIMSYILNHVVNDRIARIAQGKSVVHVQAAEISKIEITYPDPFSQKTIIAILAAISDRIDQSNAELRLLHELRKALLQKLFI
ncbi:MULTISPECIES: restriction endonuclease subunit S [unclassified Amedibacterium]|uniref:restriction endonuclease subunit S n=1 Tax=unclassified Amedibacterium TaxID=3088137 RepID=UPI000E3EEC44|nr:MULTISPECIES: restriction endonuclease subunit S [unclassified Absiella]RGB69420.1 restriction endonuclease subunit S [Absiella sp. AM09-45]RGB77811.1 restriction endonuclease subunit S [Absiella sp. AM09-50]